GAAPPGPGAPPRPAVVENPPRLMPAAPTRSADGTAAAPAARAGNPPARAAVPPRVAAAPAAPSRAPRQAQRPVADDPWSERPTLFPDGQQVGPILPPADWDDADDRDGPGRTHPLRMGRMSIGRGLSNDVVVNDLLASREHAELLVGRGGAQIVDLGSANGTFVNGQRVDRAVLSLGDVIAIGHHMFYVAEQHLTEHIETGDVEFAVDGVSVDRDGNRLLHDLTFKLPARSLLGVIGPSGAGKSTLLGALTGFRPANVGTVSYAGRDLYTEYDELRRRIGYVPQDDILHTSLTVRQALDYGAKLRFPADTTSDERRRRIDEVLAELSLTNRGSGAPAGLGAAGATQLRFLDDDEASATSGGDLADRQVAKLSGGQRKRTSVALELLTQPTLLFLDEPTSGLDPGLDKEVMETLRRLADGGRTVVVVTHSVAQLNLCDYLLVLAKGGHVAYFGPPQHALEFFDEADWADAFRVLQTNKGAKALANRFRSSDLYMRGSAVVPIARREVQALPSIRQQSVLSQLVTLSRRYMKVIASDKSYLRLLIAYPIVLGAIPWTIKTSAKFGLPSDGKPNLDAPRALLVLILMACFMGMSNAVRELVKEREIYRRERSIGLSTTAYLGSKVVVLTLITGLQGALLTAIALVTRFPPEGAVFKHAAWAEMLIAVGLTAVVSTMVGLIVSAVVDNADKTMPPLVVLTISQLVFTGALLVLPGAKGLEQLSWLFPGRWGYAAAASTSDLNTIQLSGTDANPAVKVDPLWKHTASAYAGDLVGLLIIGFVALIVTALLLRRLDPRRARNR
ncbi:ATP-binding cassette domain-containing protein, partial [Frankia sp. AgW1.1]